jgi:hypothetical protein
MENLINLVAASFARNGLAGPVGNDGSVPSHPGSRLETLQQSSPTSPLLEHNMRRRPQDDPAP